jgi:hypothetical protein
MPVNKYQFLYSHAAMSLVVAVWSRDTALRHNERLNSCRADGDWLLSSELPVCWHATVCWQAKDTVDTVISFSPHNSVYHPEQHLLLSSHFNSRRFVAAWRRDAQRPALRRCAAAVLPACAVVCTGTNTISPTHSACGECRNSEIDTERIPVASIFDGVHRAVLHDPTATSSTAATRLVDHVAWT